MIKHKIVFLSVYILTLPMLLLSFNRAFAGPDEEMGILQLVMPAVLAGAGGHGAITSWQGTATCLRCHRQEAEEVFASVHYQWLGETPYMSNGSAPQGKLDVGVNSYCINITGNWTGCGNCHAGLGARPSATLNRDQLENIDCLICHQERYKRKKVNNVFVPDTEAMTISMLTAARTVHLPTRATCLQCHAKGGGGDNYKRGDMALAHGTTTDRNFDVHMARSGADLSCQACHTTERHAMAGKGSDLRPTDLDVAMGCTICHTDKGSGLGHGDAEIDKHVARVACQSCHIATYARDAGDTVASEKTEVHRDWRKPHVTVSGAIHPTPTLAGNLLPVYRWWNGFSDNYLLFDQAVVDPVTGRVPTSRPDGKVADSNGMLYPFKYKTATQPLAIRQNELIALDTRVYFSTGDQDGATRAGLINMGYGAGEPYSWIETDTFQLISHEVQPASRALECGDCHGSSERMDLVGELGYQLKDSSKTVCSQCHEYEDAEESGYRWIHQEHVEEKGYDCSWCHGFGRPERKLKR